MWCDITIQVVANLISGVLLALIFFMLSDYFFKVPNLTGCWSFSTKTSKSSLKTYEGMILNYTALIWMEGKIIYGTAEKINEHSKDKGFIEHTGEKRRKVKISGYVLKKYLGRDRIIIHLEESGEIRESSAIHLLKFEKKILGGTFISTAADSEGTVEWNKTAGIN